MPEKPDTSTGIQPGLTSISMKHNILQTCNVTGVIFSSDKSYFIDQGSIEPNHACFFTIVNAKIKHFICRYPDKYLSYYW